VSQKAKELNKEGYMLLQHTSNNLYKSRPCFYPWQDFEIAYDAILGLSLTIDTNKSFEVYLTYYKKQKDHIELIFCDKQGTIVASVNSTINSEISTLDMMVNKPIMAGTVTVINTEESEESSKPVRVSPMCVIKASTYYKRDNIKVNGQLIPTSNISLDFGRGVDVKSTMDGDYCDILLTFTNNKETSISTSSTSTIPSYLIRYINDTLVNEDGAFEVKLPKNFDVQQLSPHMAIITDNNKYKNVESTEVATYHPELPEGTYSTDRTPIKEIAVYNEVTDQYDFASDVFDEHNFGKDATVSGWQIDSTAEASYVK
jgi:hypothetical protein